MGQTATPFKRILVAVDGSPMSANAAALAINLSQALHGELAFVHVVEAAPPANAIPAGELLEALRREGRDVLAAAVARAQVDPSPWQT